MKVLELPLEVLDIIVSHLDSCEFKPLDTVDETAAPELAACALSSRALSILARERLFHTITLSSAVRADELMELALSNEQITWWIHRVIMRGDISIGKKQVQPAEQVQSWLISDTAHQFIGKLISLRELLIQDFDTSQLEEDSPIGAPSQSWTNIYNLHSITSLGLHDCSLPSINEVSHIFTSAFPHLLHLDMVECILLVLPEDTAMANPAHIAHPHLLTLGLKNDNSGDCYVNALIGSLSCPALTHLRLTPTPSEGLLWQGPSSFQYAQRLISAAPSLVSLTLLNCIGIEPDDTPPLLFASSEITHISIQNIEAEHPPAWIPQLLLSLADPSKLRTLEVDGGSVRWRVEFWQALDEALSDRRFECASGGRTLQINNWVTGSAEDSVKKLYLPRTDVLGWFCIQTKE